MFRNNFECILHENVSDDNSNIKHFIFYVDICNYCYIKPMVTRISTKRKEKCKYRTHCRFKAYI